MGVKDRIKRIEERAAIAKPEPVIFRVMYGDEPGPVYELRGKVMQQVSEGKKPDGRK
jgi:hypothetical protein